DGAIFVEQARTEVTSQSGAAEVHRVVVRNARFGMAVRGDTFVVTADTVDLRETTDGVQRTIDVDAVIGARWRLMLGATGVSTVLTEPFVPAEIGDVS